MVAPPLLLPLLAPPVAGVVRHVEQLVLKHVLRVVAPGSGFFCRQVWMHAWLVQSLAHVAKAWHAALVQAALCVEQFVFRHVWQPALETGLVPPPPPPDEFELEQPTTASVSATKALDAIRMNLTIPTTSGRRHPPTPAS